MRAFALALPLAACMAPAPAPRGLVLDPGGLAPAGSDLRVDFGRAQDGAVRAVASLLGRGPSSIERVAECGAGPVTMAGWDNGLTLLFRDGDFAGWLWRPGRQGAGQVTTASGLTPGDPRAEAAALPDVRFLPTTLPPTLGHEEFVAGGLGGLIEGGAVTNLWAGVTCFFR